MRTINFDHCSVTTAEMETMRAAVLTEPDIVWNEAHGGYWLASRFEHVSKIARDDSHFGSAGGVLHPPSPAGIAALPIEADGPAHRAYRKLLVPLVTPERVASFEPQLRAYVSSILDRAVDGGRAWDVVGELALPLPVYAAGIMFGIAEGEELDEFQHAIQAFNAASIQGSAEEEQVAFEVMYSFFDHAIERARLRTHEELNLFSILVNSVIDGQPMNKDEIYGMALTTVTGATETLSQAIPFAVYDLATRPELFKLAASDRNLIEPLVEEVLRHDSPVWHLFRTVLSPVTIGGAEMQVGDKVMIAFDWANHDPARYGKPGEIDIESKRPTHLTFSAGAHRCVGLHSARLQLRIVLEELLTRASRIDLIGTPLPPRAHHIANRGYDRLDVVLVPK
jgi:cytochrome P450